ncbi:HAD family phosphatase [Chlamydiales bacterium]|nr:HAD family phosphatase [Chlamydiales bacterium]
MKQIKTIIVDFDGTLVNSVRALYKAYSHFLRLQNKKPTESEYITMNGFTAKEIVACLKTWHDLEEPFDELFSFFKQLVQVQYKKSLLFPGVRPFLNWTKERGIQLGIVTSSLEEWVVPILENEEISHYFSCIVTSDRILKGKPDPEGFLLAMNEMDANKESTVVIEDSPNGIEAAISAELQSIQFTGGSQLHSTHKGVIFSGGWERILSYLKKREGK